MNLNVKYLVCNFLMRNLHIYYSFGDSMKFQYGFYQQIDIEGENIHIFILFDKDYQKDIIDRIIKDFEGTVIIMTESWMKDKKWIHMLEALVEYAHEKYL